jgi:hypothetical protein
LIQVWSCGGGTQSAAIAVLILEGKLPRPDISLIVDTNREKQATWHYLDNVLSPKLAAIGIEIVRVDSSQYKRVDLYADEDEGSVLLPMYTQGSGELGKLPAYCSAEWKRDTIRRYLKQRGVTQATQWLGISLDEMNRIRAPRQQWLTWRYPLIFDVPMRRQDCINLVLERGWPEPPKSACWMCPHHQNADWLQMKADAPEDFQRAVQLEREIRAKNPTVWLHKSCKPLDEVEFDSGQFSFFDNGCASGFCGN